MLLTVEYTALDSHEHRQKLIRTLDRSVSIDRSISVRDQFPDVWFELNNPTVVDDPARRMRVLLPLTDADFPPHIQDLTAAQLTLFAVRADSLPDELTVRALRHVAASGKIDTAGPVRTVGVVVGTRRPGGAPWKSLLGTHPAGDWELELEDSPIVRSWFSGGLIQDLVLVISLAGTSADWLSARGAPA